MDFTQFSVVKKEETKTKGVFAIGPLFQGFGYTLGNSFRRTLLSALSGWAVSQIKVQGARHLFASLKGVKEDVLEIILNTKQIRIRAQKKGSFKMELDKTGPGVVKAADIQLPAGVEIINKSLEIAHLADKESRLKIKFTVDYGVGYSLAKERKEEKMGIISVDALYSPVRKVGYQVKSVRVGRKTNYDQLQLEVETDGTLLPSEAVKQAAEILVSVFSRVRDYKPARKARKASASVKKTIKVAENLAVEEFELPVRLINALKKAGYKSLSDFENVSSDDISKVKNIGEKSALELTKFLVKKGLSIK